MPTLLELLPDPITLAILALYVGLAVAEHLWPARQLPVSRAWRLRGLAAFGVTFVLSSYLPLFWDGVLAQWRLFDLSGLATGWQVAIGLLVFELVFYAWHRSLHGSDRLWRWLHQFHHSAERHDVFGAFWLSPLDAIGFAFTGSLALVLVVGLAPAAATAVILLTNFFAIFVHANLKTPYWLGYIIQRPENHSYHHKRGVHRGNFSDIPAIDALFGTFYNAPDFAPEQGFYDGASLRVLDMVAGKDLSRETQAPAQGDAEVA